MTLERQEDETFTQFTMRRIRAEIIEECAAIADAVMNDADCRATDLSYGELYGMECRSDAAKEIAAAIRGLNRQERRFLMDDLPLPEPKELRERLTFAPHPANTGCFIVGWIFSDPEHGKDRICQIIEKLERLHERA